MLERILITGSFGLVGTAATRALAGAGYAVRGFDVAAVRPEERGDVRAPEALREALASCAGVVHLAAVSRVLWGERRPEECWTTNVEGTRNVLEAAAASRHRPWVVVASSREVYGQVDTQPVAEDAPRRPVNVYGRSKAAAEDLTRAA